MCDFLTGSLKYKTTGTCSKTPLKKMASALQKISETERLAAINSQKHV
jgi:hypothetical protein